MDQIETEIRGAWEYSATKLRIQGVLRKGAVLNLRREPENHYDPNAIAVFLGLSKLGYIPRNLAVRCAPYLDKGGRVKVEIILLGERSHKLTPYPTISIKLDLESMPSPEGLDSLFIQCRKFRGVRGVYAITSRGSGKKYIGSAVDVGRRLQSHFKHLHGGIHSNTGLTRALVLHGFSGFSIELIETLEIGDLRGRERFHIQEKGSYSDGYNQTKDGQGCPPMPNTPENELLREQAKERYAAQQDAAKRRISNDQGQQTHLPEKNKTTSGCLSVLLLCSLGTFFIARMLIFG